MNTILKGDNFENECYILVHRMLENEDFGIYPSRCQVFQKKGYYSGDRKSNIIFDISIELWPKNSSNYSLLYLIECKDYGKKRIPVNDVEEFYGKIQQVTRNGVNVKGVFITRSGYQSGAFNFARSKGIMAVCADSNITYNILLYKIDSFKQKQVEEEYTITTEPDYNDPFTKTIINRRWERKIESYIIKAFLYDFCSRSEDEEVLVPTLSKRYIEVLANQVLQGYNPATLKNAIPIDWVEFLKYLKNIFELQVFFDKSLGVDASGKKLLGVCNFITNCIDIDISLLGTERFSFILAHEIGHYILHKKIVLRQNTYESFEDSMYTFSLEGHKINNDRGWIEWQANTFAACLLLPSESLVIRMAMLQEKVGLRPGSRLYVDRQKCNQDSFHKITGALASHFKTTKTSIIFRLQELELLEIHHSYKSVGEIIRENYQNILL